MSQIFISHSSSDNNAAVTLCGWLASEGWHDIFLDLDAERGIKPGEKWEMALKQAVHRCMAVLFLVSRNWLGSEWCRDEFRLARLLGKRLFGILIEEIPIGELPTFMTSEWQLVNITSGQEAGDQPPTTVHFSAKGLRRLKLGLYAAGFEPGYFPWPPRDDPNRGPYRGLMPLEEQDAGIFFGRDAPIVEALDKLRILRSAAPPRLFVIIGASGSGKSSFLRAGLLPRLARDDRNFLPLPAVRPGRAVINGESGLICSIEAALKAYQLPYTRNDIRQVVAAGAGKLSSLISKITESANRLGLDLGSEPAKPTIIWPIDQAEELFHGEGRPEAQEFVALLSELLSSAHPDLIAVITIRSDSYELLQTDPALGGFDQTTLSLSPMPRGAYQRVIEGPADRLRDTPRSLTIDPALTQALLADMESGGGRDPLALIAFTLQRLYLEFGGRGRLQLEDYQKLGGIKGSIEAAVEQAMKAADSDPRVPRDRAARLLLLRRGLIPWLAGLDLETGKPRRCIARLSEIPLEARPLIDLLKEQHLLATDRDPDSGEVTIEPAHEALLRQWGLLEGWLAEDAGFLAVLEGVRRAARDWAANNENPDWLIHSSYRLETAQRLTRERVDLGANLKAVERAYLTKCRERENAVKMGRRRVQTTIGLTSVAAVLALAYAGWLERPYLIVYSHAVIESVIAKALPEAEERKLMPKDEFQECADCPLMVVIPAGVFTMGAPDGEARKLDSEKKDYVFERPMHVTSINRQLAASKFEVTFDEWDACFMLRGCEHQPSDEKWGRGRRPVINVDWKDARQYVTWLSKRTGKTYRLLTEAEWEYAARAGSREAFTWGAEVGKGNANCDGCGSEWDNKQTAEVGSFKGNAFGLHDMHGNVWEWVEDCFTESYERAPSDGSAVALADCKRHVVRGGSWYNHPVNIRSAMRYWYVPGPQPPNQLANTKANSVGFRVARTLRQP